MAIISDRGIAVATTKDPGELLRKRRKATASLQPGRQNAG